MLMKDSIQKKLFEQVVIFLVRRGRGLKRDRIVDSTFIESLMSTRNNEKERSPEAYSDKKDIHVFLATRPTSGSMLSGGGER